MRLARLLPSLAFFLVTLTLVRPAPVYAEDVLLTPDMIRGVGTTTEQIEAYKNAIQDCSTPSLECLVHHVNRFTAIEWTTDMTGGPNMEGNPTTGAIGGLFLAMTAMYAHPVATTGTFVADALNSAHLAPPAYAQGLGFSALDPVLPLWKTFRNLSYMFFVVIFVGIGFLIMLRQKVGQAAVTAQQAIPQIIISLILVTFSYAIAGFLIDLMYVSMILITGIFSSVFAGTDPISYNILDLTGRMLGKVWDTGRGMNYDLIAGFLQSMNVDAFVTSVTSWLGALTLTVVLSVAVLIGMIKLFLQMIKAYATIVLSVVVAPVYLMVGALPGKGNVFINWIKILVGNLIIWPVILIVLAMFYAFVEGALDTEGGGFMPPFLISPSMGVGNTIVAVMGLAILLALPEITKSIKDSIAPKEGFADMIVKGGIDSVKSAWKGETPLGKMPMGLSAGNIVKGGAKLGGTGLLGATGAGLGFLAAAKSGSAANLRGGMQKGFQAGASLPRNARLILKAIPSIKKEIDELGGYDQASQLLSKLEDKVKIPAINEKIKKAKENVQESHNRRKYPHGVPPAPAAPTGGGAAPTGGPTSSPAPTTPLTPAGPTTPAPTTPSTPPPAPAAPVAPAGPTTPPPAPAAPVAPAGPTTPPPAPTTPLTPAGPTPPAPAPAASAPAASAGPSASPAPTTHISGGPTTPATPPAPPAPPAPPRINVPPSII